MRPPHRRPHRFSAHPQIDTRATSPTILGVVAVLPEPSVKMRALCIRHAHTGCLHPRAHPADASAAWRPSPHMAVEPRPDAGALTGAAAGPAGRAVETPYATIAAALSRASGIGAGNPGGPPCRAMAGIETRCDQRRPAKRPRRMGLCSEVADGGKIWRTTPPSRSDTSAARPRFSVQIARQVGSGGVEPFSFGPDKILPGTLHHSGNRPAPPSDHTPLARRSAFQKGGSEADAGIRTRPRG